MTVSDGTEADPDWFAMVVRRSVLMGYRKNARHTNWQSSNAPEEGFLVSTLAVVVVNGVAASCGEATLIVGPVFAELDGIE